MWEHRGKVAVVGLGNSPVYRTDDGSPERSLGALAVDSALKAIVDAGLDPADIDGLAVSKHQPFEGSATNNPELGKHREGVDFVTSPYLNQQLSAHGVTNVRWSDDSGRLVGHALILAAEAVAAGACAYALVVRALHNPQGRYGHGGNNVASEVAGPGQFTTPYGLAGPATYAVMYQRYLWKYGQAREKMASFAVHQRKYGLMNENSYWYQNRPEPLTRDDYLAGRMICSPISIYDCDIPVQGSASWIVTTADRAQSLRQRPAYILGHAALTERNRTVVNRLEEAEENAAELGRRLWSSSGLTPERVDVANVYDGFLCITPIWFEGVGFCGKGEFLDAIQHGRIEADGELPMTSGGNNGSGRMHGSPLVTDAIQQLQGRAGARQVKHPAIAVCVIGPTTDGQALVFGTSPS
jgi:acetyl-CoA acetyltransferase